MSNSSFKRYRVYLVVGRYGSEVEITVSVWDEKYIEGVIEYENLLNEYYIKEQEVNMSLYSELEHIYKTCVPIKTIDLADIYFCSTKQ